MILSLIKLTYEQHLIKYFLVSYRLTLDELLNNNGNEKKGKSTERLSSQPNAAGNIQTGSHF